MGGRVLILCTGNSCRSQMAEGLWRQLGGKAWEVYSAGSNPAGYVHPRAIEVMREIGLDISGQESKSLDRFRDEPFDLVITVCDRARESCPVFPRRARNAALAVSRSGPRHGKRGRSAGRLPHGARSDCQDDTRLPGRARSLMLPANKKVSSKSNSGFDRERADRFVIGLHRPVQGRFVCSPSRAWKRF